MPSGLIFLTYLPFLPRICLVLFLLCPIHTVCFNFQVAGAEPFFMRQRLASVRKHELNNGISEHLQGRIIILAQHTKYCIRNGGRDHNFCRRGAVGPSLSHDVSSTTRSARRPETFEKHLEKFSYQKKIMFNLRKSTVYQKVTSERFLSSVSQKLKTSTKKTSSMLGAAMQPRCRSFGHHFQLLQHKSINLWTLRNVALKKHFISRTMSSCSATASTAAVVKKTNSAAKTLSNMIKLPQLRKHSKHRGHITYALSIDQEKDKTTISHWRQHAKEVEEIAPRYNGNTKKALKIVPGYGFKNAKNVKESVPDSYWQTSKKMEETVLVYNRPNAKKIETFPGYNTKNDSKAVKQLPPLVQPKFSEMLFAGRNPANTVGEMLMKNLLLNRKSPMTSSLKLLSPQLLSIEQEPAAVNDSSNPFQFLSPSVLSIYNRSDALFRLPELLQADPELLASTRSTIFSFVSEFKRSQVPPAEKLLRDSPYFGRLLHRNFNSVDENEIDAFDAKQKQRFDKVWIRISQRNITWIDKRTLIGYHQNWMTNQSLRTSWRSWYKSNKNLTEADLDQLMRLNETLKFERVLKDAIILAPYIVNPASASSPSVLAPLVLSPYIVSPYIFGPFILAPLVLTPQIVSPSILAPSVLAPLVISPLILSPQAFDPSVLSPAVLSPAILSPFLLSPGVLSPSVLSPCILSPAVLSPVTLNPSALSPSVLCPGVLSGSTLSPGV